jgi:hypothetical protein
MNAMSFIDSREKLHRLAEQVVSPARVHATGNEIALTPTPGGWGTPPFPDGGWMRVEGAELVQKDSDGTETRSNIDVDPADAARLADFFAFAHDVLEALREHAADPSEIHLWPEHFDVAFEAGEVNYGASPGDEQHDEPYLYVGPWPAPEPGPLWNATAFPGAELTWPVDEARALAFFRERRDAVTSR